MEPIVFLIFILVAWLIYRYLYNKFLDENKNKASTPPLPRRIKQEDYFAKKNSCVVAIIDTESTGLSSADEPVSIGIILYEVSTDKGLKLAEIDRYYGEREPGVAIHPRAAAVNGMTLERLKGKRLNITKIKTLINQADILIAHNAKFDYRMTWQIYEGVSKKIWACSIQSLKSYWQSYPNKKLDTLCEAFNIERKSPHNALSDCEALADLLFQHTGKTKRSSTYMGALIRRPVLSSY